MKKFKFTWGHAMVLALLAFMIFIISFLLRFSYNQGNSMDLVREDYYTAGVNYQSKIDALKRAKKLDIQSPFVELDGNLLLELPDTITIKNGELYAYRASDKNLDRRIPLKLEEGKMLISGEAFKPGNYELSLSWKDENDSSYAVIQKILWK